MRCEGGKIQDPNTKFQDPRYYESRLFVYGTGYELANYELG